MNEIIIPDAYYRLQAAARLLGRHRNTVTKYINSGYFPNMIVDACGTKRIPGKDLLAFMKSGQSLKL